MSNSQWLERPDTEQTVAESVWHYEFSDDDCGLLDPDEIDRELSLESTTFVGNDGEELKVSHVVGGGDSREDELDVLSDRDQLERLVKCLTPGERQVIRALVREANQVAIAKELQITPARVYQRKVMALIKLQELVRK